VLLRDILSIRADQYGTEYLVRTVAGGVEWREALCDGSLFSAQGRITGEVQFIAEF
jgi:hypothetical protein